jgi:uncharacterized protein (DUF2252 family)
MSQFAGRPAERTALLVAERNHKMAVSAHAYVRGSTASFHEWLEASKRDTIPEGPPAWICGYCHVGNLRPVASAEGELGIQVRDLDQTVIGQPCARSDPSGAFPRDGARGSNLPGLTTAHMLERMIEGYQSAFTPEALRVF